LTIKFTLNTECSRRATIVPRRRLRPGG